MIIRTVLFLSFVVVAIVGSGHSFAGSAPLPFSVPHPSLPHRTVPFPLPGALNNPLNPFTEERNTCDPEFYEVMKDRAWMEAQRELTQNANLITRPDSVLTVSCFGSFLDHAGAYAGYTSLISGSAGNFPGRPDESLDESLIDIFLDIAMQTDYELEFLILDDPYLSNGFFLYGALELLVLDQLQEDVTLLGTVFDITDNPAMALCTNYYIEDNFPNIMLEDRAKPEGGPPAWTQINADLGDSVSRSGYVYNCNDMNRVWQRAKCYDFATESVMDVSPPNTGAAANIMFHDGFYTLDQYTTNAAGGNDYRTNGFNAVCDAPSGDAFRTPDGDDLCTVALTGGSLPPLPTVTVLTGTGLPPPAIPTITLFPSGGPTWNDASTGADPDPGTAGAPDPYLPYIDMLVGSLVAAPNPPSPPPPVGAAVPGNVALTCAPPIQTGVVVARGAVQYIDAVCPTPGCWFNPPASTGALGSCSD